MLSPTTSITPTLSVSAPLCSSLKAQPMRLPSEDSPNRSTKKRESLPGQVELTSPISFSIAFTPLDGTLPCADLPVAVKSLPPTFALQESGTTLCAVPPETSSKPEPSSGAFSLSTSMPFSPYTAGNDASGVIPNVGSSSVSR